MCVAVVRSKANGLSVFCVVFTNNSPPPAYHHYHTTPPMLQARRRRLLSHLRLGAPIRGRRLASRGAVSPGGSFNTATRVHVRLTSDPLTRCHVHEAHHKAHRPHPNPARRRCHFHGSAFDKEKKKITGEEINILQACQAHLSGARLAARPLTHMIAWAAVHFLSVSLFLPPFPLSPRNCLFAALRLSIVSLDEGEVCKEEKEEEARDAERGASSASATHPTS